MTNNADLYQELLKAGAPELPKGYFYKAWQNKRKKEPYSHRETGSSRALCVEVRKKVCGSLFSLNAANGSYWYFSQAELNSRWSEDNQTLLNRGWITEADLDGNYRLAHMALLAEQANKDRIEKEKLKNTKSVDNSTYRISAFLNKRLP